MNTAMDTRSWYQTVVDAPEYSPGWINATYSFGLKLQELASDVAEGMFNNELWPLLPSDDTRFNGETIESADVEAWVAEQFTQGLEKALALCKLVDEHEALQCDGEAPYDDDDTEEDEVESTNE